jgi:hypothetical protein
MVKPRRLQIRITEKAYTELITQSLLLDLPISQIVRLKLQGKKICKRVNEDD